MPFRRLALLPLALAAVSCSEPPPPRPLSSFGRPLPTASTTAEPLWLRSGGPAPAASSAAPATRPPGP